MMSFLKKYGFYLAVTLCVLAVAAGSYYAVDSIAGRLEPPDQQSTPTPDGPEIDLAPTPVIKPDPQPVAPDPQPEPQPEPQPAAAIIEPEKPAYGQPATGTVSQPFSGDTLVYHETLGEWRTHNGVDYAVQADASAVAVYGGKVVRSESDDLWGDTVELLLDTGYTARYCGLEKGSGLAVGQRVEKGDVVGTVGETAVIEAALGRHLHFELLLGDRYVDPAEVLGD